MKLFAISDLHLSFNENIDKPMHVFGRGWDNHASRLKEAWLSRVSEDDVVVIPGDISWGLKLEEAMDDIEWIHSLPGTKLISKGNHDLWWSRINYLNTLHDDIVFLQNDCYYAEEINTVITATRGWPYPGSSEYSEHDEKMYRRELMRLRMGLDSARSKAPSDARIVVALHYPPSDNHGIETEFTRVLEEYGVSLCVYGHLHGVNAFETGIKGVHRGVEYRLVSIDYLSAVPREI
ncbi:MAG: metallophosphoesterase [Anaerovoracaceae bacterium]